jgi:hypothetical protein
MRRRPDSGTGGYSRASSKGFPKKEDGFSWLRSFICPLYSGLAVCELTDFYSFSPPCLFSPCFMVRDSGNGFSCLYPLPVLSSAGRSLPF